LDALAERLEFSEVYRDEAQEGSEELLDETVLERVLALSALFFSLELGGAWLCYSQERVKEDEKVATNVLCHLVRSFFFEVIRDIAFNRINVLKQKSELVTNLQQQDTESLTKFG